MSFIDSEETFICQGSLVKIIYEVINYLIGSLLLHYTFIYSSDYSTACWEIRKVINYIQTVSYKLGTEFL